MQQTSRKSALAKRDFSLRKEQQGTGVKGLAVISRAESLKKGFVQMHIIVSTPRLTVRGQEKGDLGYTL